MSNLTQAPHEDPLVCPPGLLEVINFGTTRSSHLKPMSTHTLEFIVKSRR
jgi:hypothetical protein